MIHYFNQFYIITLRLLVTLYLPFTFFPVTHASQMLTLTILPIIYLPTATCRFMNCWIKDADSVTVNSRYSNLTGSSQLPEDYLSVFLICHSLFKVVITLFWRALLNLPLLLLEVAALKRQRILNPEIFTNFLPHSLHVEASFLYLSW